MAGPPVTPRRARPPRTQDRAARMTQPHAPQPLAAAPDGAFSEAFAAELDALFAWRRDVRRFRPDPVPAPLLDAILAAAGGAPSVGLSEPWRLVLVESETGRDVARESFARCNAEALAAQTPEDAPLYAALKLEGLREAPVQLAVFCDEADEKGSGLGARTMPEARRYSVVCAIMQMWLAARARGVGMGWVSIMEPEAMRRAAAAPESWAPVAWLCIGWPRETHLDCDLERAGWSAREKLDGRVFRA